MFYLLYNFIPFYDNLSTKNLREKRKKIVFKAQYTTDVFLEWNH